jgi:hypothetical protein
VRGCGQTAAENDRYRRDSDPPIHGRRILAGT